MDRTTIVILSILIALVVVYAVWDFEFYHRPHMDTPRSDYSGTHSP